MTRIAARFDALRTEGKSAFITFVMAGDPDHETSLKILQGLPEAGADLIELGMPFTDPMADGPAIQAAGLRALKEGANMKRTLALARSFRERDESTPLVLMGYYNPIYAYGVPAFLRDAKEAGVDGLIVVDLPPEEDEELCLPAKGAGLDFIRLATPTTDAARLPMVLRHVSGFLYYVSITGITGAASFAQADVEAAVARLKRATDLPVAVGFGIKTQAQATAIARFADAAVVGSALVDEVAGAIKDGPKGDPARAVLKLARALGEGVHGARKEPR